MPDARPRVGLRVLVCVVVVLAAVLATAVALAAPSGTGAARAVTFGGEVRTGDGLVAADALLPFDVVERLPGWSLTFGPARDDVRGLTTPDTRHIQIFVRPDDDEQQLARVVAHEIGHALDLELNSPGDRARWLEVRGLDQAFPWWPSGTTRDFHVGAGDFAEAFASWQTGVASVSEVGGPLDDAARALLVELTSPRD